MTDIYRLVVEDAASGPIVVRIEGEIDLSSAPAIGADLAEALARRDLAVDLADVEFIDSAGVRMLVELAGAVGEGRGPVSLVAPGGSAARRMLELTGIEQMFAVVESREGLAPNA